MLVTAIALFFSTFSTPDPVGRLHVRAVRRRALQRRSAQFQDAVDSPAAARLARGLYWVLPNLAQFDVKADVVHGQPVPLGYMAVTVALCGAATSRCCW